MPNFTSNRVLSLFEDSHGTLWIGAETGEIYTLRNLKLEEFHSTLDFKRKTVWGFEQDAAGNLFVASDSGLEKIRFDDRGVADPNSVKLLSHELSYGIRKDPAGKIWVKIYKHYFAVEDDQLIPAAAKGLSLPDGILQIRFADDGRVLTGTYGSLGVANERGYTERLRFTGGSNGGFSSAVSNSTFWFQQMDELIEVSDSAVVHHDLKGIVTGGSRAMLFDNEDNLWIATQYDGLVRVTRRRIGLMSDQTEHEIAGILTLAEDVDGSIWFGARSLFRLREGQIDSFSPTKSNSEFVVVRSIAIGPDGTRWVGGTLGLHRFQDNGTIIPEPRFADKEIYALFFDKDGALWIGSSTGLDRLSGDELLHYAVADGLVDDNVHFITQTLDGTLWIGTVHGLSKFRNGRFENVTIKEGLPAGYVRDIVEDDDGTIWLATYGGGIVRNRGDKYVPIRRSEGLPNNFVSRILISGEKFWILSNLGIFTVDRRDLNAVADGTLNILIGSNYDTADGMPSSEANGGHQSAGIKTRDGRLWFPMIKDVVIIDPTFSSSHPPRVAIEAATSQRSTDPNHSSTLFDVSEELNLPEDQRNLGIEYTGLSFTNPEDLRFFYKLEGLEEEWVDAGQRRTAFYPYLPAGEFTFQVKVVNSSGIWSGNIASLRVSIKPKFWETWWFLTVALLTFSGVVAFLFIVRQRQHWERESIQQEFAGRLINAHELERQRMATELHDGLGQSLLLIKNWASLASADKQVEGDTAGYLSKISSTAAASIEETRSIVQDLSPQTLNIFGLTEAIKNMVEQIQDATGIVIEYEIQNVDKLLTKEGEISAFRIIQECLNNVAKHSGSAKAKVGVTTEGDEILIRVEDFGKGFEATGSGDFIGSEKGLGLFGISERVRFLNGDLRIDSLVGQGTTVSIRIRDGKMTRIKVLIADDHPIFREGLAQVIGAHENMEVVGAAHSGLAALELVPSRAPHIAVLDVSMPEMDGIETARRIKQLAPQVQIVFLTMHRTRSILDSMTTVGAKGYVLKDAAMEEVVVCIETVIAGSSYISPLLSDWSFRVPLKNETWTSDLFS